MTLVCVWCGKGFEPRTTGGRAQRFCCPAHRISYAIKARQYVDHEIVAGRLTVAALKAAIVGKHNELVHYGNEFVGSGAEPITASAKTEIAPSAEAVAAR